MLRTMNRAGCRWSIPSLLLIVSLVLAVNTSPVWGQNNRSIKAMTQNMDSGTDLKLIFFYLNQYPQNPDLGVTIGTTYTYAEILQSDIPGRAGRLADEIAAKKPDVISLQEVTLWRTGSAVTTAENVLFDQLTLLLDALSERKEPYDAIITQELTDVAEPMDVTLLGLPANPQLAALRYTDRDVILVRSDPEKAPIITFSNATSGKYAAILNFGPLGLPIDAKRGWMSVNAKVGNTVLTLFGTHLESTYAGTDGFDDLARGVQALQAKELALRMNGAGTPVMLAGDFNSNAVPNGFENTDTTGILYGAGFTEVWGALHPDETGFTWPLYFQDPPEPNPAGPFERIDLIYQKGLEMVNIERIIRQNSPIASDHAGVVATIRIGK